MRRFLTTVSGVFLAVALAFGQTAAGVPTKPGVLPAPTPGVGVSDGMAAMGQFFMENKGQWDERVLFRGAFPDMHVWMTRDGLVIDHHRRVMGEGQDQRVGHVVKLDFVGASAQSRGDGVGRSTIKVDFFSGSFSPRNARGVGAYGEAFLRNLYPGIDMRLYRYKGLPRWDLIVQPGVDPKQIQFDIVGADAKIDARGDISIQTVLGPLRQRHLMAYQVSAKGKRQVPAAFRMAGENRIAFQLGSYDRSLPLVIDPLVYGSYVGGDGDYDEATAVASNNTDTVYVAGITQNPAFPITAGPYGVNWKDSLDGFVFSMQGDAYAVNYVAYLSGVGEDDVRWLSIDQYGNLWVAGNSNSIWFPNDLNQFLVRTGLDVTGGSWFIRNIDLQTVLIPHNATAGDIDTALTDAFDPPGPPAGWEVQGGPFAVTSDDSIPIHVRAFGPLSPLRPQVRVNAYIVQGADLNQRIVLPPTAVGVPPIPPPPGATPNWGFTPSGGTFTLTFDPGALGGGDEQTTTPIPWDADAATVQAALVALAAIGDADVVCIGGPLPGNSIDITFQGAITSANRLVLNGAALRTGNVGLQNGFNRGFAVRFALDPSGGLDPVSVPVTRALPDGQITGFAVRPVPTPTGLVHLTFVGDGTSSVVPGPAQAGGFIASYTYVNGAADIPRTFVSEVIPATTLNAAGTRYLGGTGERSIADVVVDAEGSIYVTGTLGGGNRFLGPGSPHFATTLGIFRGGDLLRGNDLFIRKYSSTGTLQYSGVIGGSGNDRADAMAVDQLGNVYVLGVGRSFNFPRTRGVFGEVFGSGPTVVVTKVSADGSQILYSTNLRTIGAVDPNGIAVDSRGNAYVVGTVGFDIVGFGVPTLPGSAPTRDPLDSAYNAGDRIFSPPAPLDSTSEGWFGVLNATATGLLYASYIGENGNENVNDVAVDRTDSVWLAGFSGLVENLYNAGAGFGFGNGVFEPPPFGLPTNNVTTLAFKANFDGNGDGFVQKYRIALPILSGLVLNPTQIAGGLGVFSTGVVTLREPAPAGGAIVTVRVLNPAIARLDRVGGPTSRRFTIPQGQSTATFQVFSNRALTPSSVDIRAEMDTDFLVARLNIRPWLSSFTLNTDSVAGGNTFSGTVTLFQPAPTGGVTAQFSTDTTSLVSFPNPTLTIPEGQQSINFDVNTEGVAANTTVAITATVEGVGLTQNVILRPATIVDVTFNPVRVNGGESAIGTVRLDGKAVASTSVLLTTSPTGPRIWAVAPSQPGTHPIGAYNLLPGAGATEAYFQIDTNAVLGTNTSINVTATTNASTAVGTLLVDANNIVSVNINAPLVSGVKSVGGGTVVTGTVTLLQPASPSGFRVPLTNSNTVAGSISPTTVFVPPGATSASFTVTTNVVTSTQTMRVRANKPGYATPFDDLQVRSLNFSFTISPSTVVGGLQNATGTVRLLGAETAPAGGILVTLSSAQPSSVSVPASVTIPQGGNQVSFPVTTSTVNSDRVVRVSAVFPGGATNFVDMNVLAPGVISVSVSPNAFTGGSSAQGTVVLNRAAPPGGLVVTLTSNNAALTVPVSVTVPSGQTAANFQVTSVPVAVDQTVVVTARRGASTATSNVTVRASQFVSMVFQPSVVLGGASTTGTISLDQRAPAGGLTINLAIVSPPGFAGASVPASVTIPAGAFTTQFLATTRQVSRTIDVVVRATAPGGRTVQGTFRINPNPNP